MHKEYSSMNIRYFFKILMYCFITSQSMYVNAHISQKSIFVSDLSKSVAVTIQDIINRTNPHMNIGIKIVTMQGNVIYEHNAQRLFVSASNTKLFTAAASFHYLGESFYFQTKIVTDGIIDTDGTIHGNLYLKGAGDPSLTDQDLDGLVKNLVAKGIKKVTGALCIDCSDFDDNPYCAGCSFDDIGKNYNPPLLGLILNRNHSSSITQTLDRQTILFVAAEKFKNLCSAHGIQTADNVSIQTAPDYGQVLAVHNSETLESLVWEMLKSSDNIFANALFKKIGAACCGVPGSWEKGKQAIENFLRESIGIDPDELLIDEGSGLSRYNAIAPNHFVKLLQWIHKQPFFNTFVTCLPHAGIDGTLKSRMLTCKDAIKAKTGSLTGVTTLSGYIYTHHMPTLIFSILINGFVQPRSSNCSPINYKNNVEDEICMYLHDLFQIHEPGIAHLPSHSEQAPGLVMLN